MVAKAMASPPDLTVLETIESAYVIGRGASLPMAIEAALKLKEIALLHAEAGQHRRGNARAARHRQQEARRARIRDPGAGWQIGRRGVARALGAGFVDKPHFLA